MSISVEDLTTQALVLPAEDRAKLVERLIASFEPRSPSEVAWLTLAARRRDDVRAGKVAMVPVDDAIARVRARIA
jgi:putative addiction module component (TIGR02574 family)